MSNERDCNDQQMIDEQAHQEWLIEAEQQAEYKEWLSDAQEKCGYTAWLNSTSMQSDLPAPHAPLPMSTRTNCYEHGFTYDNGRFV